MSMYKEFTDAKNVAVEDDTSVGVAPTTQAADSDQNASLSTIDAQEIIVVIFDNSDALSPVPYRDNSSSLHTTTTRKTAAI